MGMKATYDPEAKALYVYVQEGGFAEIDYTEELVENMITVDIGINDRVVGMEFLDVELRTLSG